MDFGKKARILVVVVACAVSPVHADQPKDASAAFWAELGYFPDDDQIPPTQRWTWLAGCRRELDDPAMTRTRDYQHEGLCGRLATTLAGHARGQEREDVFALLETRPQDDWMRPALLNGLLDAALDEAILHHPTTPRGARPTRATPAGSEYLPVLPAELMESWQLQAALQAHYFDQAKFAAANEPALCYPGNEAAFDRAVGAFLHNRATPEDTLATIGRYEWNAGCNRELAIGHFTQTSVMALAFLATGDVETAAGGLLTERHDYYHGDEQDRLRRLLMSAGIDWEQALVGRFVDGDLLALRAVATHGSNRGARLLFAARNVRTWSTSELISDLRDFPYAMAAFVTPSGGCEGYRMVHGWQMSRADETEPIAADLQGQILDFLARRIAPDAGIDEAADAAHLLIKACRTESLPAFRTMLHSRYSRVVEIGTLALRSLGEGPGPIRPPRPLVVRVSIDGVPAANSQLSWEVSRTFGSSGTRSAKTDGAGMLQIDRDPFVDTKTSVRTAKLATPPLRSFDDTWFEFQLPNPIVLDREIPAPIQTQILHVSCDEAGSEPLAITLNAPFFPGADKNGFKAISSGLSLTSPGSVTFSSLQRGQYQVNITGPLGTWDSEIINLGATPRKIACGAWSPPRPRRF